MSSALQSRSALPNRSWRPCGVVMVAALVLAGLMAGAGSVLAQESRGQTMALGLAEAVELALSYDLEHAVARVQWDNARIASRIAQASGPLSPYDQLKQELEERRAEHQYVSARRSLVTNVIREYLELKQAERRLDIARRQLDVGRQELAIVRELVRIGQRHQLDELREANRVEELALEVDAAERDYETRRRAFLQRLGLDEDVQLRLVDEPEAMPWTWDIGQTLAYAAENAFSVWERAATLRIAAMDLEAVRIEDPPPLQLEKAENDYRIAELNAQQAERTFVNSVRTAFHKVTDAARRLETAAVDYELAKAEYDVARRRHQAGLTTDLDMERAEIELRSAEQAHYDALYTYVLARLELLNLIGHPLDLGEEVAE